MQKTTVALVLFLGACGTSDTQSDDVAVDAATGDSQTDVADAAVDDVADTTSDASDTTDAAADTTPDIDPLDVGNIAISCGSSMQDLVPVDCTRYGDVDSFCVFGNHCACSDGFECEVPYPDTDGPECAAGSVCVPRDP